VKGLHRVAVHWAVHLQQKPHQPASGGTGELLCCGQVQGVQPSLQHMKQPIKRAGEHNSGCPLPPATVQCQQDRPGRAGGANMMTMRHEALLDHPGRRHVRSGGLDGGRWTVDGGRRTPGAISSPAMLKA
jgi:hypothetical protein